MFPHANISSLSCSLCSVGICQILLNEKNILLWSIVLYDVLYVLQWQCSLSLYVWICCILMHYRQQDWMKDIYGDRNRNICLQQPHVPQLNNNVTSTDRCVWIWQQCVVVASETEGGEWVSALSAGCTEARDGNGYQQLQTAGGPAEGQREATHRGQPEVCTGSAGTHC